MDNGQYYHQYPPPSPYRDSTQSFPLRGEDAFGDSTTNLAPKMEPYTDQPEHSQHLNSYLPSGSNFKPPRPPWYKNKVIVWSVAIAVILIVGLGIFFPIWFLVINKDVERQTSSATNGTTSGGSTAGGANTGNGNNTPVKPTVQLKTGGDGSTITTENGTTFIYRNSFGGIWVQDPEQPFSNDARCNSWTPPLSQKWTWGVDQANGVNLGGLFVIEPFITPHFFQRYPNTTDEFTLSAAMAADTANGGLDQLERHYDTFITEYDIAQIAGAGLNFLRVPIGFWAIETYDGESYLERTSWKYFLRVLGWARKYGLRVWLDVHGFPGSQNGLNHSGRLGSVNFLAGNMGIANADRALYYLRVFTQFISQPEYKDLILILGIVNEPGVSTIGMGPITSFNLKAHDMIRSITGYGEGNGPYIAIGDGFRPLRDWAGHLAGADRMILDKHPYFAFADGLHMPMAVVGDDGIMGGSWPRMACDAWSADNNVSKRAFGVTVNGEMSAAPNDCGLFMRAVGIDSYHPQCNEYNAWETYNTTMKEGLLNFVSATFDSLHDWWFWTWKIGPSIAGRVETPLWSYSLGLEQGWIPKDPRTVRGLCGRLGINNEPFDGNFQPWMTGGVTSSIPAAVSTFYPWPPTSIANIDVPMSLLPTYTNTGPIITLPPATFTGAPAAATQGADGWANPADNSGGVGPVAGCQYPDPYDASFTAIPTPTAPCTGPS